MTEAKLTPWFDGSVKPVRKGVYERLADSDGWIAFSRWDGRKWRLNKLNKSGAARAENGSTFQTIRWRGLASNPLAATNTKE